MSFSAEWNERYLNNQQMSIWPWSDVISYIKRYADFNNAPLKVLELGCGAGANIPFFESLNMEYFAIEGSEHIVSQLKSKFPHYSHNIKQGDFTSHIPFDTCFDIVVDRASLTHNSTKAIENCLRLLSLVMKPNSIFIGIDWFSTKHSDYLKGLPAEDGYTRCNIDSGAFHQVGKVHFSDQAHLEEIFLPYFTLERLEHKLVTTCIPPTEHQMASWNLLAKKKENK